MKLYSVNMHDKVDHRVGLSNLLKQAAHFSPLLRSTFFPSSVEILIYKSPCQRPHLKPGSKSSLKELKEEKRTCSTTGSLSISSSSIRSKSGKLDK
jgi:hypothetical protein